MNFFQHQDQARSTTKKLVFLFVCAIIVLIVATTFLITITLSLTESYSTASLGFNQGFLASEILLMVSVGVLSVVGLGSAYRFSQLRGGGKSVAEAMGGRLLNISTLDADERKVLNVVEEMALASGLPVPSVYLIEEEGINAFAAGYQQQDAVIGITRGCIQALSREELQGVIAHEFSHIFNGDMRLNIRLMGILYGIMVLGIIGYYILRSSMYRGRSSRGNKKGGGIVFLGLGLVVIGYGGTFFGNMIKAGVSRQREFLADASAVQFTRNPDGISGALKKIGASVHGSTLKNKETSEISHMLFAAGLASSFSGLFATHPPLHERIERIDPHWAGNSFDEQRPSSSSRAGSTAENGVMGFSEHASLSPEGVSAIESIGSPSSAHIDQALTQLGQISESLKQDAHSSLGACSLVYALLINHSDQTIAQRQLFLLEEGLSKQNFAELLHILTRVKGLKRELYLSVVDIALPSLKQLSPAQYRTFMSYLTQLIVEDEHINLFEWSLFKILRYNLDPPSAFSIKNYDMSSLDRECEYLLSVVAAAGHDNDNVAETSFNEAKQVLVAPGSLSFKKGADLDTQSLDKAVDKLKYLKPLQKPRLLKAIVKCIDNDGRVTAAEAELLRGIAALLDCPIPPLLSGQSFI